jgi:hypothetical protein
MIKKKMVFLFSGFLPIAKYKQTHQTNTSLLLAPNHSEGWWEHSSSGAAPIARLK